jgi:hypothetical protein
MCEEPIYSLSASFSSSPSARYQQVFTTIVSSDLPLDHSALLPSSGQGILGYPPTLSMHTVDFGRLRPAKTHAFGERRRLCLGKGCAG